MASTSSSGSGGASGARPPATIDRSAIADQPLFEGLAPAELDRAAAFARPRLVKKGEALFREGEAPHGMFLILDGRLKASRVTPDGQQVVMRFAGPGDLVGHVAVLRGASYPATALAVVDTLVLAWEPQSFMQLLSAVPRLALNGFRMLGERIAEAHTRVQQSETERVERRIANAVLRLARQAGEKTEAGIEIRFPVSRQDIAEMTGATLHTVSRTLSAWESQGILDGGRQRIVVRDPHALVRIADQL